VAAKKTGNTAAPKVGPAYPVAGIPQKKKKRIIIIINHGNSSDQP
jgi:hypothetical protein